jgi:hypothetical protein
LGWPATGDPLAEPRNSRTVLSLTVVSSMPPEGRRSVTATRVSSGALVRVDGEVSSRTDGWSATAAAERGGALASAAAANVRDTAAGDRVAFGAAGAAGFAWAAFSACSAVPAQAPGKPPGGTATLNSVRPSRVSVTAFTATVTAVRPSRFF